VKYFLKSEFKRGWFIGDFEPTVFKTPFFEVSLMRHKKGESYILHYHKAATEINYVVTGRLILKDSPTGRVDFTAGDVVVVDPGEVLNWEFLTDVELVVVKTPSLPKDKYELDKSNIQDSE